MDNLINLNTDPEIQQDLASDTYFEHSGDTSVLRRYMPNRADYRNAGLHGALRGLLFALVPALGILVWLLIGMDDARDFDVRTLIAVPAVILTAGVIISVLFARMQLENQAKKGYMAVSDRKLEYWTREGIVTLPMDKVFGTGSGRTWLNAKVLSIFYLSDNKRGFDRKDYDFKRYYVASGPARKHGKASEDGLLQAREAIMHHYNRRVSADLPVASLPEFRFSATASHKDKLLWGETVVDAEFSCDGETVRYRKKEEKYEFPVTAVRDARIDEVSGQYGRTKYEVILTLDPTYGPAELKINILLMSNNDEVDRYCRALPSVFTRSTLDGYWS